MFRKLQKLLQDPHIPYPIGLEFPEYLTQCKNLIAAHRLDLNDANRDQIISANAPFEFLPSNAERSYGALLVHGLFDSPFMMKDLGRKLASQGILTRSVLLPGHGTVPGALLHVDYHDWIATVKYGVAALAREVDNVFLIGFSTGGALALYHALQDNAVSGICLIAPALKINSAFAYCAQYPSLFERYFKKMAWFHIAAENDYAKYQSICFNSIAQVYKLGKEILKTSKTKTLNCPMLVTLAENDETVLSKITLQYFAKQTNSENKLILYSNRENKFTDPRIIVRNSCYPEENIVDFSHICLPIAPDNPHYGKNGEYLYASRTNCPEVLYGAYNTVDKYFHNGLYHLKITKHYQQTLTYNPDFEFLALAIQKFILSTGKKIPVST